MPKGIDVSWLILLLIQWPLNAASLFSTDSDCRQEAVDRSKANDRDNKATTQSEPQKNWYRRDSWYICLGVYIVLGL